MKNEIEYLVGCEESRWMVLSSLLYLVPTFYSFHRKLYYYSILSGLVCLISVNYWVKATVGWRRDLDLFFSKLSFIIYLADGLLFVRGSRNMIVWYSGLGILIYSYYNSMKLFDSGDEWWVCYHMSFHLACSVEQIIILHALWMRGVVPKSL